MKNVAQTSMTLCAALLLAMKGLAGPADTQAILKALDANHVQMVQAFVDRDAEAFASCWMPDAVCVVEELPVIRGRDPLKTIFLDAVGGAGMHGLEKLDRRIWKSGDFIYETGIYVHRFALTGREQVQSNAKSFVTVWRKQSDGSWKRAVEAWNNRPVPSADQLTEWRKQTVQDIPFIVVEGSDGGPEDTIEKLIIREQAFHDIYLTEDAGPAIEMYTEDARVLSGGRDWCVGKEQIRNMVKEGRKQVKLIAIECESIDSDGNQQMIYIVNRFRWQFSPVGGDGTIHNFYGKGLHIWQRQSDGQWKIVIDINSTNPPPETGL